MTILKHELETMRTAFQGAVRLLKDSRRELREIREEATCFAKECETSIDKLVSSNRELQEINRHLGELIARSSLAFGDPQPRGCVDRSPPPSSRLHVPAAGIGRLEGKRWDANRLAAWQENAACRLSGLTPRQREIMAMIVKGCANKIIAVDLHISQRTVENHRASIMRKTGSQSLPALTRLALFALASDAEELLEVAQPRLDHPVVPTDST